MGTRGAVVLVTGGEEKGFYNHWDSYPSGLGESTLDWLKEVLGTHREDEVRTRVANLVSIDETAEPTLEQRNKLNANAQAAGYGGMEAFCDTNVSTGKDWYSYLRKAQGDIELALAAGFFADSSAFPLESLWCEWAYVIDFDQQVFEVYRGFQESLPTEGRYVGRTPKHSGTIADRYYPCTLVKAYPFHDLPDNLDECNPVESDDEADALT